MTEIPVTPDMVHAGLAVRLDPHMHFETDEKRLIEEYRAMERAKERERNER